MDSKDLDESPAAVADADHNNRGDMMEDNASVADVLAVKSQVVVRNDKVVVVLNHLLV